MFERDLRDLTGIQRWTIVPSLHGQNVAEHSFMVAVYADQLATYFGWNGDRGALLRYALWHDVEELFTGDVPRPVKYKTFGGEARKWLDAWLTKSFPKGEWRKPDDAVLTGLVRLADCVDAVLWVRHAGNDHSNLLVALHKRFMAVLSALPFAEDAKHHVIFQLDAAAESRPSPRTDALAVDELKWSFGPS